MNHDSSNIKKLILCSSIPLQESTPIALIYWVQIWSVYEEGTYVLDYSFLTNQDSGESGDMDYVTSCRPFPLIGYFN